MVRVLPEGLNARLNFLLEETGVSSPVVSDILLCVMHCMLFALVVNKLD